MKGIAVSQQFSNISFAGLAVLAAVSIVSGIAFDCFYLFFIPPVLLFFWFALFDFGKIYYCMIFLIPFTREIIFPGGLGLDIPVEPLVIILAGILLFYLVQQKDIAFYKNPVIIVLFLHIVWIAITVIFSEKIFIGVKWLLAKIWFVATFVFITSIVIKRLSDFKFFFWTIIIPSLISVSVVIIRHAGTAFDFEKINWACAIFFRNHVNYAAFVSLLIPFIWLAGTWYRKGTIGSHFVTLLKVVFLVATYFAYARGAWLALIAAVCFYYAMKYRLIMISTLVIIISVVMVGIHLGSEKQFMGYAPEFEKAVSHGNIIDHLKATLKNQDVSTAERFYRWVSGVRMATEHPFTGFGPGCFYHFYKQYTVTAFRTYVSDNPEKSGVHNYLLMTLIEQGFPGLMIFLLLTFFIFYEGIKYYHRTSDKNQKNYIAAILCSLIVIYVQLMLSDLIEALQIGSFFFINVALLVNVGTRKSIPTG